MAPMSPMMPAKPKTLSSETTPTTTTSTFGGMVAEEGTVSPPSPTIPTSQITTPSTGTTTTTTTTQFDDLSADADAIAAAAERRMGKLNQLSSAMLKKLKASETRSAALFAENESLKQQLKVLDEKLASANARIATLEGRSLG